MARMMVSEEVPMKNTIIFLYFFRKRGHKESRS